MLSGKSRPVIQATLPVVGAHIQEIAEHFYKHMFSIHPELLDGTFNRGNQADGKQQLALAGSVAAFATALVKTPDHLPENLLSRIAHKHASLGIQPEQYRIVHDSLMWAVADVQGDAVTPEIAAAWDEERGLSQRRPASYLRLACRDKDREDRNPGPQRRNREPMTNERAAARASPRSLTWGPPK